MPDEWLDFARAWRDAQVAELGGQLRRVTGGAPPGAASRDGQRRMRRVPGTRCAGIRACGIAGADVHASPRVLWQRRGDGGSACPPGARRGAGLGPGVRSVRRGRDAVRQGPSLMWIVKIGGSLNTNPNLPAWLNLLAQCGGGRVTVVSGGGNFADEVRRAQAHWQFGELSAHNMAVLAMAQTAYLMHGLNPALAADAQQGRHPARAAQRTDGAVVALRNAAPQAGSPRRTGMSPRTASRSNSRGA